MPLPIVLVHISKGCVDTTLGSNGVGSGGEEFGDAGCFET